MSVKPHQHAHLANGIRRIKQAIKNCDLPLSEVGTIFPKEYTHIDLLEFELHIFKKMGDGLFNELFLSH